jgi:ABC-type Fe3+/spermidine/putrescine transport system ATPase subunit
VSARQFELRSVSKRYAGETVLSEVSLTLRPGQHTAILGPSGCGKSTLLRLLAGLEPPCGGEVLLGGEAISRPGSTLLPPHQRGVAMVFQDLALWPNLSVLENVLLGQSGARLPRPEALSRARRALALCGIERLGSRLPTTLSGGEQQRAAVARALALEASFLFLDEPFAGLDLVTKTKLLADIRGLAKDRDFTILLVTHDPLEAMSLCQWCIVLDAGKVIAAAELRELLQNPQSELLEVFCDQLGKLT